MGHKFEILKDETKTKELRYISFMGNYQRYDFALMQYEEDPNKTVVIHLQKNRFIVVGKEDLNNDNRDVEHILHETAMEADEVRAFLKEIL
ncbi:SAV0927 family protein [Oceanobacillus manasiensis]|uniref:SAV0927 family protein n=1 Tax=Oceanobacillus manasiensis TaxID=586413 RepID=UPI0005AA1157|nr:SAV0927 family protein [Oceanobacillus manasiensis]